MNRLKDDDLDIDRFRIAVLYIMDAEGINQKDLSQKSGISASHLNTLLNESPKIKAPLAMCHTIKEALGAKSFEDVYERGEKAAQDVISDEDFIKAISAVRVSKGMSFTKLSKQSGVSDSQISSFISTNGDIFLSAKARIGIRNALGATSFTSLVEMGKQAEEENTFNNDCFRKALENIIKDKKIVIGSLADEAQVPRNKISAFIHRRASISLEACHRIREALGAENFRELYQMGGVSLPPPYNGIGDVVDSILTLPIVRVGKVKENSPIVEK